MKFGIRSYHWILAVIIFVSGVVLYFRYVDQGRTQDGILLAVQYLALAVAVLLGPEKSWRELPFWRISTAVVAILVYVCIAILFLI